MLYYRTPVCRFLLSCVLFILIAGQCFANKKPTRVLIFSKVYKSYRHVKTAECVAALKVLLETNGMKADTTENDSVFTAKGLKPYRVLIFLNTAGDVLNSDEQQALVDFIHNGGGFVGLHAASATLKNWPWFGGLVGAVLKHDQSPVPATVHVVDAKHPSTRGLPDTWVHTDQWMEFREPPKDVNILITVDGTSLTGYATMTNAYPVSWCHEYEGGRAFYTSMGHENYYSEPEFGKHILGAVRWAAGYNK